MGCKYRVGSDGSRKVLTIECRDCVHSMSLEKGEECLRGAVEILLDEGEVDSVVLQELVRKEYDGEWLEFLRDVVDIHEGTRNWHANWHPINGCAVCKGERESILKDILSDSLTKHPAGAYGELAKCIREEEAKEESAEREECVECRHRYAKELLSLKGIFEERKFFIMLRAQGLSYPVDRSVYAALGAPAIRPYFSTSRIVLKPPKDAALIDSYDVGDSTVRIYLPSSKPEYLYFLVPPEYELPPRKFEIINEARRSLLKRRPASLDFRDPLKWRRYFGRLARKAIADAAGEGLLMEELKELADILIKYTAGFGILEVLLEDDLIRDIYVNAPGSEMPICVNHSSFDECATNIYLSGEDVDAMISRFRARSGRSFSEAHPVLDMELPEFKTRVAAIGRPLSPDGVALALRRQKSTPWTLPQLIANSALDPLAAGLLSFLVDGQTTILVTGSRGSGKTSLLVALLSELAQGLRILTIEDTLEIPVGSFNAIGYRIQRLKIRSAVGGSKTEMAPQDALSAALRLGESVLVIGEVRGPETRILYESMRVGAAGNSVLGTIHGSSASSVFERVIYDMGIPASSFKATDLVVAAAPIRLGGGLRSSRRVVQISEVRKDWSEAVPRAAEMFMDLMSYDPASDALNATNEYRSASGLIARIARKWNMSYREAIENIELRANIKGYIVEASRKHSMPRLLELTHVVRSNNAFRMLNEEQLGERRMDYERLFGEWKQWFEGYVESLR